MNYFDFVHSCLPILIASVPIPRTTASTVITRWHYHYKLHQAIHGTDFRQAILAICMP